MQNPWISRNKGLVFLGLTLLFALGLRLVFFTGIGPSDSMTYAEISHSLANGRYTLEGGLSAFRIGLFYPVAAIYSFFGVNELTTNLFALVVSLASIVLVYFFGKMLFGEKAGLFAAFLLSFFPIEVVYATRLNVDLTSAFFVALSVYLFLKSERISGKTASNIYLGAAGLSLGASYLIKEFSLLIGLFFLAYALYRKKIRSGYIIMALGFALVFSLELLYFLNAAGDPFFRYTGVGNELTAVTETDNYGRGSFPLSLFHYPYIIFTDTLLSLFYVFFFIAIAYCIMMKKKETYVLLLWFLPLLLYISFGTESLTQYVPIPGAARFLFMLNIPGVLLLSFFLSENEPIIRKALMPGIVIILLATSVGYIYLSDYRFSLKDERAAYSYLKELPEKTVYTDHRTIRVLNYISGFEGSKDIEPFNKYTFLDPENTYALDLSKIDDSYVVINRELIGFFLSSKKGVVFPEQIYDIPEHWVLKEKFGKAGKEVEVYYIP